MKPNGEASIDSNSDVSGGDTQLQNCAVMDAPITSRYFPPVELADPDGLLCFGGELSPDWLLEAYGQGIFPWPVLDVPEPMAWWSPDPRAIFPLNGLRVSRRLCRTLRSGKFAATCNRDFGAVVSGCATAQERAGATWILPELALAYGKLHELGYAHSIEVWHENKLAGGIYGVALGALFAGESMFYNIRDASKVALAYLIVHLQAKGFTLFDIQQLTPHTEQLGAIEISRNDYLTRLKSALTKKTSFGEKLEGKIERLYAHQSGKI